MLLGRRGLMNAHSDLLVVVTWGGNQKMGVRPRLGSAEKNGGLVMSAVDAEWEGIGMPGIYRSHSQVEEA